jgi:uncharacterized protein (TIGR00255 family)
MTGFGRCRETVDGLDITVEIKSVNSRFLDLSAKVSRAYGYLEERIKPYLMGKGITRGKVDVWISIEVMDSGNVEITTDDGYIKGYLEALYTLRDKYGLRDDISVMTVARNTEIFQIKKPEEDIERDWARVLTVLEKATAALLAVTARCCTRPAALFCTKLCKTFRKGDKITLIFAKRLARYARVCYNEREIKNGGHHYVRYHHLAARQHQQALSASPEVRATFHHLARGQDHYGRKPVSPRYRHPDHQR